MYGRRACEVARSQAFKEEKGVLINIETDVFDLSSPRRMRHKEISTGDVVMEVEKVESPGFGLPFMSLLFLPIRPCRISFDCQLQVTLLAVESIDIIPFMPKWSKCLGGYSLLSRQLQ